MKVWAKSKAMADNPYEAPKSELGPTSATKKSVFEGPLLGMAMIFLLLGPISGATMAKFEQETWPVVLAAVSTCGGTICVTLSFGLFRRRRAAQRNNRR